MSGINGHLADRWAELVKDETRIKKEKERLRTMILLTGENFIYGTDINIGISTITANKFDSKSFQLHNKKLAEQYRMNVNSTRIDIYKKGVG